MDTQPNPTITGLVSMNAAQTSSDANVHADANETHAVDMINHPPHYTSHPVFPGECIDWIWDLPKAQSDIGKYAWRLNDKDTPASNAGKIEFYAKFLLEQILTDNFTAYPDTTWRLVMLNRHFQQWYDTTRAQCAPDELLSNDIRNESFVDPELEIIRRTSMIIIDMLSITATNFHRSAQQQTDHARDTANSAQSLVCYLDELKQVTQN